VRPEACDGCGTSFAGLTGGELSGKIAHIDLPAIEALITLFRIWRIRCPCCGKRVTGVPPAGVAESLCGPRVRALVATLVALYRMSRDEVGPAFGALFGINISKGSVQACCERASEAVAPAVEAIKADIAADHNVNMDETSWKQAASSSGCGWWRRRLRSTS